MKHTVEGREVDWAGPPSGVTVVSAGDRLAVRTAAGTATALAVRAGDVVWIGYRGRTYRIEPTSRRRAADHVHLSGDVAAPMPGVVVEVGVAEGDLVAAGDRLAVVEAMKTHLALTAPFAGRVARVDARAGAPVTEGQVLVRVEPEAAPEP